ncbi:endolytic transglycosylase MltG [Streptomyces sp. HNM0645]|uniref:endolytic transglycosylase MltG n=1 Tax=Streptomyces sp. HNM0645 TaxID=2782343 RepID=UPI0024B6E3E5|nr:endolytic transglycosylase MltG [Streptomyces sp. HNM0645]MDI9884887.1 endolytic transglycosylase MltG [Streptomyces sp. HNM0645]
MKREFPKARRRRRRLRLTRRGRLLLFTGAVGLIGAVTAAVLTLLPQSKKKPTAPQARPKTLLIPEGWRSSQVYAAVDKALGVRAGTTRRTATAAGPRLRLPAAARGNPEGYLFPATYPVGPESSPGSLLSFMVNTAGHRLGTSSLTDAARRHGMTLHQTVIIASIVQAEADSAEDMARVARVVHNRLARNMPLQMDSTLNYALNRSTLDTTRQDTGLRSPYNTYAQRGLPPTPIGNPGEAAMKAAVGPAEGDWLYFVTVRPGDTRFTADFEEHNRNVAEFNRTRSSAGPDAG